MQLSRLNIDGILNKLDHQRLQVLIVHLPKLVLPFSYFTLGLCVVLELVNL